MKCGTILLSALLAGLLLHTHASSNAKSHNAILKKEKSELKTLMKELERELKDENLLNNEINYNERGADTDSGSGEITTEATPPQTTPLPDNGIVVSCKRNIIIKVRENSIFNNVRHLELSANTGPECEPELRGKYVVFKFGLDECGTKVESTEDHISYENSIRVIKDLDKGDIQREHEQAINFRCLYDRKNNLDTVEFTGDVKTIVYEAEEFGKFSLSMGLYTDKFQTAVQPNDAIDVLDTVYAQLRVASSSSKINMAVQSCIATPANTPPADSTYTHALIENRCFTDSTVKYYPGRSNNKKYSFSFQSFVFVELGDDVYLHCAVVLCETSDASAVCQNPSGACSYRQRRWAEVDDKKYRQFSISNGPFKQHRHERSVELAAGEKNTEVGDWRMIAAFAGSGLFIVAVVAAVVWNKRRNTFKYSRLQAISDSRFD